MAELGVPLEQDVQISLPKLRNIVAEIEEIQGAFTEIKTTSKFIQKRLDQQDERNKQINDRNGVKKTDEDFTEIFQKKLLELEKKDAEQSENIKELVSSVQLLSEKVTSLCKTVDVSNSLPRQQNAPGDAQQTDNHGDNSSISQIEYSGKDGQSEAEHLRRKTSPVRTDNRLTTKADKNCTTKKQKQNIESKSVNKHPHKQEKESNKQRPQTNVMSMKVLDMEKLGSDSSSKGNTKKDELIENQAKDNYKTLFQKWSKQMDKTLLKLLDEEISKEKSLNLPKGRGPKTVLLIDTSECYIAEDIMRIKSGCNKLIACIEDVAISENIEENLAVVTVGKRVKIAHHLTNDYESVTDCINKLRVTGGPCLLMEGLFMSLRIIMNQECCFWSVNNYMVPSRIILITDGYDSIADFLDGVGSLHKTEVQEKITKFCEHLTRFSLAKVACVPVRDDYCQPLLKKIAESTHGKIILLADIQRLGRHYKNAKIADNIRNDISEELQTLSIVINRYVEKNDEVADDDIKENQVKEKTIKVGQRVERGPDWIIENEDNGGPGTVVGFTEDGKFLVEWDNRECGIYNLGNGNKQVIPSDKPRFLHDELIAVGCEVKRGKNWRHGNQDGGSGNQGVVFRVEPTGIVHVKWSRGGAYTYKYGFKGYFEVEVCDPSIVNEKALQDKAESSSKEETGGESNSGTEFESEKPASKSIPVYDLPPPTLTNQSDTFIIDDQADSGTNSGETPSEVRDGKLEDSVTSIEPMQDDKLQMVGDNIPMTHGDLPMTHDALPITDGNLQVMHGDLPVTGDDNTSVTRDITHSGDKIPVTSDNISERDNHSKVIDHNLTNERVNANPEKSRNDIKPKSENNNNSDKDGVNVVMDSGLNSGNGELQDLLSSKCETDAKVNVQNVKGNIMFTAVRNNTKQENSMENMSASDGARQKIADINEELDSVTGRRFLSLNDKDLPSASLTKYEMGEPLTDVKKDSLNILPQTQKNLQQGDESLTNLKKDITKFSKPQEKILEGGGESSKDLKKEILKFLPELQENFGLSDESSTNEKKESLKLIPPQHHQNLECQTVGMNFDSSHTGIPVQASSARSNNNQGLKFDRPGHIEDSDVFSDTASMVSDISTVIQSCGIWEWKSRRGDWIPYTSAACQKIEKAYRRPKKCTALVEVNGEWYRVVVSKMVQIHTKTRQITSIRRREITDLDD